MLQEAIKFHKHVFIFILTYVAYLMTTKGEFIVKGQLYSNDSVTTSNVFLLQSLPTTPFIIFSCLRFWKEIKRKRCSSLSDVLQF